MEKDSPMMYSPATKRPKDTMTAMMFTSQHYRALSVVPHLFLLAKHWRSNKPGFVPDRPMS